MINSVYQIFHFDTILIIKTNIRDFPLHSNKFDSI